MEVSSLTSTPSAPPRAQVVIARDASPGCTFVWDPRAREIRDLRVYVEGRLRGQGYGSLIVVFVKALFFPFVSDDLGLCLPLGGIRLPPPERITLLPSDKAKAFYLRHGFRSVKTENKHVFTAPAPKLE